jgi:hypothetical protein
MAYNQVDEKYRYYLFQDEGESILFMLERVQMNPDLYCPIFSSKGKENAFIFEQAQQIEKCSEYFREEELEEIFGEEIPKTEYYWMTM